MAGIKKSCVLTQNEFDQLEAIKDKALGKKVVLNDSQIIRLGINSIARLSINELIKTIGKTNENDK